MFKHLSDEAIAKLQDGQACKWEEARLLEKCVEGRAEAPLFMFYEGPPTANGKPGIHHVMARTLKDSVNRHKTMQGFRVPRKAGWDTHGLPVEIEVEKALGLVTKKDIEDYGIGAFNEQCRASVFKYEGLWREMSRRMGFWADMDKPYITLDNDYIETEWHILKRFFEQGLMYEGHKILPWCPRCGTGLASHEVSLGYKEVKTNTVTVLFKRKGADEHFLAWTTTPWTLAANTALTVGPDIRYVRVRVRTDEELVAAGAKASAVSKDHGGKVVWVAAGLADKVVGAGAYEILEELPGNALEGIEYEQLMPFVEAKPPTGGRAFIVTVNDYVTTEDGTGIVHTAPAFGEDDYQTGRKYGLPVPNPVDEAGKYTDTPWQGRFVMEDGLDVDIMKWLAGEGKLFSKEKVEHNYPFCWRCDTPLIYYSKPSWYIEMTKLKDALVENNDSVDWYPDFVGEGRFGNWLENVKDWAISRSRYWGTPLPIWRCEGCGALSCVGSRKELQERGMETVADGADGVPDIELHRPWVDDIHIKCETCGGTMERVPEVIDCWFDSGAMPFAQQHWPFENADRFDTELFPADFICEGIDQTRGWFYSLMAISTFVMGKAPYRNVLVNDLILDKEGKKMSKTRGNAVDPFDQFDKFGADATRWYLLHTSPAWSPTKYDEEGVQEVSSKFFGTLRNTYYFFVLYANQDGVDPRSYESPQESRPELDRWILSKFHHLVRDAVGDMDAYDHMKAVRRIQEFTVEDFSNWYIRRARRRFWAEGDSEDKRAVYATAYEILVGLSKLIAPFAPFLSDEIYVNLTGEESVHLALYPGVDEARFDDALEDRMDLVRTIVSLGRGVREKERLKVRQPLPAVLVDGKYEASIGAAADLIREELNVKEVRFERDLGGYMDFAVKPDFKAAGPRLGARMKAFAASLAQADASALLAATDGLPEGGQLVWSLADSAVRAGAAAPTSEDEVLIDASCLSVLINAKEGFAVAMEGGVFAILDRTLTSELVSEGLAREFVSKVQQLRKNLGLEMMDSIEVAFAGDAEVCAAVEAHRVYIEKETLALRLSPEAAGAADTADTEGACGSDGADDTYDLNGHRTAIRVRKVGA
ncbi:MAG: isoleucine--tRNA ligase [Clostridiales Family XIII bacterium]|jgi:isoleucyl-tRNA synthetase|nr:isoleucine--tRNA ligase [Clostridiales Family XIII bacterium]